MSDRPWYKRYGADFVHGTLGLSLEEKGAYSLCLDLIYDRGGPIPDDARWLAGVCGVSVRRWSAIRSRLLEAGKLTTKDGLLSNSRAEIELENAAKISRKHAENGAKGGNKRAENGGASNRNNDLDEAKLKHRARDQKPEPDISPSLRSGDSARTPREELLVVLDDEHSEAVIAHRKAKRAPLTPRAALLLARQFAKAPNPNEAADVMIQRGWTGYDHDWVVGGLGRGPPRRKATFADIEAAADDFLRNHADDETPDDTRQALPH